jgi:hypothetical protein
MGQSSVTGENEKMSKELGKWLAKKYLPTILTSLSFLYVVMYFAKSNLPLIG